MAGKVDPEEVAVATELKDAREHDVGPGREVEWLPNGKPKVYVRRWFVMLALGLTYAGWNMTGSRQVIISPSYAKYHDVPNQAFSADGVGIDFMTTLDAIILLFAYLPAAWAVDKFGLIVMWVGAGAIAAGAWIWYFAGTNYTVVLLGRALTDVFGPLVAASLLAVSNRWFPENERAIATASASLLSLLGSGAALILSPLFATGDGEELVDFTLKSCDLDGVRDDAALGPSFIADVNNKTAFNETMQCVGDVIEAKDYFCCYLPVDIDALNLINALIPTFFFIFTVLSVRNNPPTAPSPAGLTKDSVGMIRGLKLLFTTKRFALLALSDFIVSGPVLVLFVAIARIFPAEISEYNFIASVLGLGLAIPTALFVAWRLDKKKQYYMYTAGGYCSGTLMWVIGTIGFATDSTFGNWVFFGSVVIALSLYIAWQTAVYETKLEYVFTEKTSLEGWIVGSDRLVINLSSLIFVASLSPEVVGGALNTFIIGAVIMAIGCIPVLLVPDRFTYLRLRHDEACKATRDADGL